MSFYEICLEKENLKYSKQVLKRRMNLSVIIEGGDFKCIF